MFEFLGKTVERRWQWVLALWGVALLAALGLHGRWYNRLGLVQRPVPTLRDVAEDGEFAFLPGNMQSLVAEQVFATAFPEDLLKSSVVIVVRRYQQPIQQKDNEFIDKVLKPRLEEIGKTLGNDPDLEVRTSDNRLAGKLLVSEDQQASLVIMPLKSEFLEWRNKPVIDRIEKLLDDLETETNSNGRPIKPVGLALDMSGSATVGRDMLVANDRSGKATERWTFGLVIVLLLLIYRAPLLAFIPLVTVMVAVNIALSLVVLLTQVPLFHYRVFFGIDVYITVVVYGTVVDYCLFFIARYKEELDSGLPLRQALSATLSHVGAAITYSALTVICGIGMMVLAQFGKFREAGIGIALSLVVGLFAALTLTPALLRLAGRTAFWPYGKTERIPSAAGWLSGTTLISRLVEHNWFQVQWKKIGDLLVRYPGRVLACSVGVMVPFALVGLVYYDYLSYGLLSELPHSTQSVKGAKAVQDHFPAGYAGPLTVILKNEQLDFSSTSGADLLEKAIRRLEEKSVELGIADIRYYQRPLGKRLEAATGATKKIERDRAKPYYISQVPELKDYVTRVDVVFNTDPFDRQSIRQLNDVEGSLQIAIAQSAAETELQIEETARANPEQADAIREELKECTAFRRSELHFVGPTASIRDLKTVTDKDQIRIDIAVLIVVFLILVLLLRKPAISLYLIVSVFFSYFVTLGVTFALFYALDQQNFAGLDWKVPMFLFTILMAIGEDYNIFLMTRIEEEQRRHGLVEGVRVAMLRTGTIISSCGIIMAGTFTSLILGGALVGMRQLGFALAFGVLLDTFVVRPLLVPAYLILLYNGRFGSLTRLLGGGELVPQKKPKTHPARIHERADV